MLIVKKYGGSSVSTPEKILAIARKLKTLRDQGHKLIIIVSAMGDTTDDLVQLSRRITHTPIQREMDMLLSSGERISMALMAMALNSVGAPAISFTGSQSGVLTDGSHNSARIKDIKAFRVQEELEKNRIVIIAGFQGVNPQTKEVTTLGRGGSDTTAVAFAAAFKADRCDILTDVRGLYSIDPRVSGARPKHFPKLDYATTLEMTYWGARVLHYRAVELAERAGLKLNVDLSSDEGAGTIIDEMEETDIRAVNFNEAVCSLSFEKNFSCEQALDALQASLNSKNLPVPQILCERQTSTSRDLFLTAPVELFDGIQTALTAWCEKNSLGSPKFERGFASVTLTGRGLVNSDVLFEATKLLSKNQIAVESVINSPLSHTFLVAQDKAALASRLLHEQFVNT